VGLPDIVKRIQDEANLESERYMTDTKVRISKMREASSRELKAAMAEMEREMISSRCREATARCRATGRVYGRTPFGFRREGDRLVPDPAEAAVLEGMRAERAAGAAFHAIAEGLNARGIRPKAGAAWYGSSVRCVLATSETLVF